MNIVERYVSAYIVRCITGIDGEQPEWVYEVLRETKAHVDNALLALVVKMVQGSEADTLDLRNSIAGLVAGYSKEYTQRLIDAEVAELGKYKAFYSKEDDVTVYTVWKGHSLRGIVTADSDERMREAEGSIAKMFKDVEFINANE